eukprot:c45503_g1_i1 orf=139-336(+)
MNYTPPPLSCTHKHNLFLFKSVYICDEYELRLDNSQHCSCMCMQVWIGSTENKNRKRNPDPHCTP